jgi:hypothetical protein
VPVSAMMFPDEITKYFGVIKPERAAEEFFFHLNKTFDKLPE